MHPGTKIIMLSLSFAVLACGAGQRPESRSGGCTVETNKDNTSTIKCDDGSSAVVSNGQNGAACTAERFSTYRDPTTNKDVARGGTTISCPNAAPVFVLDGSPGPTGPAGKDGVPPPNVFSCTITELPAVEGAEAHVLFSCLDKDQKAQSFIVPKSKKV